MRFFVIIFCLILLICNIISHQVIKLKFHEDQIFVGANDFLYLENHLENYDKKYFDVIFESDLCINTEKIPICNDEENFFVEKVNDCYDHFNSKNFESILNFKEFIDCCLFSVLKNYVHVCENFDKSIIEYKYKQCLMDEKDPFYQNY
ncbi:hypothetical protein GVAV_002733 [Gurleya vavrai]